MMNGQMMKEDIISIITPVYNSEAYLPECIESVIGQTDPNWELILIDDGSTDNSGAICDEYAGKDGRITVIHQKNAGQFKSRMAGITIAAGNYCTGLDSDDYLAPDCVEILREILAAHRYDILAWNIRSFSGENTIACGKYDRYGEYDRQDFIKYIIESTNHSFCNKLIRIDLMREAYYGNVPLNARQSEDYIMICPAVCRAKEICVIDKCLYNYRQLDSSVTHVYSAKRVIDNLDSSVCIREILSHYDMLDAETEALEDKSLVSTIGNQLKQAFKRGKLVASDKDIIRSHPIYMRLRKYEKRDYLNPDVVFFMKLFRMRMDWLLNILYKSILRG